MMYDLRVPADRKRIPELRELLNRANRAYYADAAPIMSDPEFDKLLAELADLEAKHPELADMTPLDGKRKTVAILTLIIFALCFVPFPIQIN